MFSGIRNEYDNFPVCQESYTYFDDILNHSIGLDRMEWRHRTSHRISHDWYDILNHITYSQPSGYYTQPYHIHHSVLNKYLQKGTQIFKDPDTYLKCLPGEP